MEQEPQPLVCMYMCVGGRGIFATAAEFNPDRQQNKNLFMLYHNYPLNIQTF